MLRRKMMLLVAAAAMSALAGCQAVETTAGYTPANCGMVGSSCSSGR
jgi:uncharacterized lipoprotein YajG